MTGFNLLGLNLHDDDFHKDENSALNDILEGAFSDLDSFKEVGEAIKALQAQEDPSEAVKQYLSSSEASKQISDAVAAAAEKAGYATAQDIKDAIAKVVGGAGESFDTLKEIETWIANNGTADIVKAINDHAENIKDLQKAVENIPADVKNLTDSTNLLKHLEIGTTSNTAAAGDHNHDGVYGTYSKPESGIPASDLAEGVIPKVPKFVSNLTEDAWNSKLDSSNTSEVVLEATDENGNVITYKLFGVKSE